MKYVEKKQGVLMGDNNQMKTDAIYDARSLGMPKMLLLGLQHMFAMFGATVLVPILVNSYFHGEGKSFPTPAAASWWRDFFT